MILPLFLSLCLICLLFYAPISTSSITSWPYSQHLDLPPTGHRHWEQLFWHDILHPSPTWEALCQQPLGTDTGGLLGVCPPYCAWSRHTVLPLRHTGGSLLHHGRSKTRGQKDVSFHPTLIWNKGISLVMGVSGKWVNHGVLEWLKCCSLKTVWIVLVYLCNRCEAVIGEFLASIKKAPEKVKFADMINIVITHAQSNDPVVQVCPQLYGYWIEVVFTLRLHIDLRIWIC